MIEEIIMIDLAAQYLEIRQLEKQQCMLKAMVITSGLTTLWGITHYFALKNRTYEYKTSLFGKIVDTNDLLFWLSLFSSNVVIFSGVYRLST